MGRLPAMSLVTFQKEFETRRSNERVHRARDRSGG